MAALKCCGSTQPPHTPANPVVVDVLDCLNVFVIGDWFKWNAKDIGMIEVISSGGITGDLGLWSLQRTRQILEGLPSSTSSGGTGIRSLEAWMQKRHFECTVSYQSRHMVWRFVGNVYRIVHNIDDDGGGGGDHGSVEAAMVLVVMIMILMSRRTIKFLDLRPLSFHW